mgnify:CR=1 FL=1
MSTIGLVCLLVVAAPARACGPCSGFTIKNMVPPLPTLIIEENIQGMDARVRWTSEVSFTMLLLIENLCLESRMISHMNVTFQNQLRISSF